MRSLLGTLAAGLSNLADPNTVKTPVPFASTRPNTVLTAFARDDRTGQLASMGSVGTLFAIVDRLANATSQVEWHLYQKSKSGLKEDRTEVTEHACIDLWQKPNDYMPRQEFMETVQQHWELTGEGYPLIARDPRVNLPLELWPARPDRMYPVPHPTKFLTGWMYVSPDGEKVPLGLNEVMQLRRPNPMDIYRGIAPTAAMMDDLESSRYAAQWNRNFFLNGAEPGGLLLTEENLGDDEFRQLQTRWNEQHRGVSRAHRVAILERGMKWENRSITQKDMQFVKLREASRDTIMEGFAFGKPMLGVTDDVNRANAEAGEVVFARWQLVGRLERWKALLNHDLLPQFGATTRNLEWDYDNPVPEDRAAENEALTARSNAAKTLTEAGWHPEDVLAATGLPPMRFEKPAPPPPPIPPPTAPAEEDEDEDAADEDEEPVTATAVRVPRAELPRPRAADDPGDIDLTPVQEAWEATLAVLLAEWGTITAAQRAELRAQITAAVEAGDLEALTALSVSTEDAAVLLGRHLDDLADTAARRVVQEATEQGVDGVDPVTPESSTLADLAKVTAGMLGAGLALAAGREAMRVQSPGMSGAAVADAVEEFLAGQSDATARTELGGALTGAQNGARTATLKAAPVAALYANEKLDNNTCQPCREIDGRFIGLSDNGTVMEEVDRLYPMGGYVDCLGRSRCRGTVVGVWRPQTTSGDGE